LIFTSREQKLFALPNPQLAHYPEKMPSHLKRYHQSGQSHFITFTCYHRLPQLQDPKSRDTFVLTLERSRIKYNFRVYGYVVMPEHVHLLISEPERDTIAQAMQSLKTSSSKQIAIHPLWQKRYYDRNVRDEREFSVKLRYLHRNPVKRGLVAEPAEWKWSSFRHYALREVGIVEIESEWTARDRETQAHAGPARVFLNPGKRPKPGREPGAPGKERKDGSPQVKF